MLFFKYSRYLWVEVPVHYRFRSLSQNLNTGPDQYLNTGPDEFRIHSHATIGYAQVAGLCSHVLIFFCVFMLRISLLLIINSLTVRRDFELLLLKSYFSSMNARNPFIY